MTPREFFAAFRTRSGKFILFGLVFGGGLLLFSALRQDDDGSIKAGFLKSASNKKDKPQVVQTVERPMDLFRPPQPKPEPPVRLPKTPEPARVASPPLKSEPPPASPAPISLFADSSAGVTEPKALGAVYAPFGRLIPCETVITVDSSSVRTPIVGLITEDVYHAGQLVIPAGTEVHGTAQTDRKRERIASGAAWTLVWQTGEEMRLRGIALDREFSGDQEGWGITDGSAGLRGRIIKSDDLAEIKLFAATLLSGAASALTEKETTILGTIDSRSLNNAPLKGAQDVLKIYSQRILDAIERDGFYVRIASGKQFYIYVLQTIDPSEAVIGGTGQPFAGERQVRHFDLHETPSSSPEEVGASMPSSQPPTAKLAQTP